MDNWTYHFDGYLKRFYAIDHTDAGLGEQELTRYRDMKPREAALALGEDYELTRTDGPWGC